MKSIDEQSIRRAIGPKIRWNNLGTNWQWWNSIKIFITETYWLWVLWPSFFPRIQLVSRLCKSGLLHRLCLNQIKMFMPSWYNCKFTSYLPWLVPEWMILVALSNTFHEKGWNFYMISEHIQVQIHQLQKMLCIKVRLITVWSSPSSFNPYNWTLIDPAASYQMRLRTQPDVL